MSVGKHSGGESHSDGPRIVMVSEGSESDLSSNSSTSSDDENDRDIMKDVTIPPEYWHIQKLIKYMKAGNQTATMVSLSCLKDHDLSTEINQKAIQDVGGLEVLVNLLETKDMKCKIGALAVLKEITLNLDIRKRVTDLGAVPLLVVILSDPTKDLQILAAETIGNLGKVRKARKSVRKNGGIPKLVDLLDIGASCLTTPRSDLSDDDGILLEIARAGARALWSMSVSCRNREAMRKHGIVPLFGRLLKTVHIDIAIPAMGTLQQCASEPSFQLAIQTEGMIPDIVLHLSGDNTELKMYCSRAIYKCASDGSTREAVREAGGLEPLVGALAGARNDRPLLAALTGALWRCSADDSKGGARKRLEALEAVEETVRLLDHDDDEVLTNAAGALAEAAKWPPNREKLRVADGIQRLVNHLNSSHKPLLENVSLVLMECAKDPECMAQIEELDGVRMIWSLLKNDSPRVQANACLALGPCVDNATESGVLVRSFVGALELIVSLLKCGESCVLAAVCAAIATIAKDRDNLAVISDHGVVAKLAALVNTTDDDLRRGLAEAIAYCCDWAHNRQEFGRLGAIEPLVGYLTSKDIRVHRSTALALYHLSFYSINCVTMHQAGVVKFLLGTVGSTDEKLQEASAGCLCNIRRLALDTDSVKPNLKQ